MDVARLIRQEVVHLLPGEAGRTVPVRVEGGELAAGPTQPVPLLASAWTADVPALPVSSYQRAWFLAGRAGHRVVSKPCVARPADAAHDQA